MSTSAAAWPAMLRLRRFLTISGSSFTTVDGGSEEGHPDLSDASNADVVSIRNSRGEITWQIENAQDSLPLSEPTLVRQNGYIIEGTSRQDQSDLASEYPLEPAAILYRRVSLLASLSFLSCAEQHKINQHNLNRKDDPDASAGAVPAFRPVLVR